MEKNKTIKAEIIEQLPPRKSNSTATPRSTTTEPPPLSVIDLSSSDSDSDSDDDDGRSKKKSRIDESQAKLVLPAGFLDPLPHKEPSSSSSPASLALAVPVARASKQSAVVGTEFNSKQFWKAGDYEGADSGGWESSSLVGGMDHVRVHPRFLHSNATSHKWVLGAFAELLDNSLDEVCNGATYVKIDMTKNKKDGSRMLLIEDNGGGMNPDKMRQCMSLGYSAKSKIADTIGQYGNGFKTSTMRLGADVIVFSRCCGKSGERSTQSIGLLSYTFLRSTGKEDIVVPMLDYEKMGQVWNKIARPTGGWSQNVETVIHWSPFSSEEELLQQFNRIQDHGTLVFIYNLWEDDQGLLELDFDADPHDIQIRGVNRDEKSIQMAQQYPNSRHFLTYRHSLRSYASILYLRIPPGFRMILRGKDVEHHNIVNDMMMTKEVTYRPQPGADGVHRDLNMVAVVTIGFVKDAKAHIDVQGFNVYHKNRLIKPFWRVWHAPGSDGRGVIGLLEANFVEPAHDKQGFERTIVLSRLETKLVQMQKTYWSTYCHRIGYAPRRNKNAVHESEEFEDYPSRTPKSAKMHSASSDKAKGSENRFSLRSKSQEKSCRNGHFQEDGRNNVSRKRTSSPEPSSPSVEDVSDDEGPGTNKRIRQSRYPQKSLASMGLQGKDSSQVLHSTPESRRGDVQQNRPKSGKHLNLESQRDEVTENDLSEARDQLKEENRMLKERLKRKEEEILGELLKDLDDERARAKFLEAQLEEANYKIQELNKEQESLVEIFSEERQRRDVEEENLRKKLKEASNTIQELLDKIRMVEKTRYSSIGKNR